MSDLDDLEALADQFRADNTCSDGRFANGKRFAKQVLGNKGARSTGAMTRPGRADPKRADAKLKRF